MKDKTRCDWSSSNELMIEYHDTEWGVPLHDDQKLFEFLCLEGAQAGLSWQTILNRRENYRIVFDNFDPEKIAKYGDKEVEKLVLDKRIIRNRGKINAFISNAKLFLEIVEEFGSFDKYIWQFVDHKPIDNAFKKMSDLPAKTEISEIMSKTMKKRGFKFVGPTICYAFMQATGMVNDHTRECFRYKQVRK